MREEKKGFPYDPAPDVNRFPGVPESGFDLVNEYGTYNIRGRRQTRRPRGRRFLAKKHESTRIFSLQRVKNMKLSKNSSKVRKSEKKRILSSFKLCFVITHKKVLKIWRLRYLTVFSQRNII